MFGTGTFRYRDHAQDLESELGKLHRKSTGISKVLSYGHRNVQGIVYLKDEQQICQQSMDQMEEMKLISINLNLLIRSILVGQFHHMVITMHPARLISREQLFLI